MNHSLRRDSPIWLLASVTLLLLTIAGVAAAAGPTAFVAVLLIGVTFVYQPQKRDVARLVLVSAMLLVLGVAASVIPTGDRCGIPIVESAKHSTEPTPHVHGPCEQGNDRRGLAGIVLVLGATATTVFARRRATADKVSGSAAPPGL